MRLKLIKLAGFKSFVEPTRIEFSADMTAVVGPNGCGKSNVIDAVRWVLGESSARHLRGTGHCSVSGDPSPRDPLHEISNDGARRLVLVDHAALRLSAAAAWVSVAREPRA